MPSLNPDFSKMSLPQLMKSIKKIDSLKKLIIFSVIFAIAFLLRAQETLFNNYLFLIDMGRDMMAVKGILYDHHLTLIGPYTSLAGVFQGPLWYYLLSIPTFITNGDPWGAVALMLIISLATGVVAFLWMNKLFGFGAAIVTFLLIAISPEAVAAATYSWNPHPMWFLLTIYTFLLFMIVSGKQKFHLLLWPTITLMSHFQTALAVFLFLATILFFLFLKFRFSIKRYILIGILISSIFLIPQVAFDLRHDFLMSRSVIALIKGENRGLSVNGEKNERKLLNLHKDHFIINFKSSFLSSGYFVYFPHVIAVLSAVLFIGRRRDFSKKEVLFVETILTIVFTIFLISLFYPFPMRYWFFTGFQMFYLLPAGLILSKLLNFSLGRLTIAVFILSIVPFLLNRINHLYIKYPNDNNYSKIRAIKSAVDYVYKDAKGERFGLLVFTPPVYTFSYDYVIWWYGGNKYNYIPHQEKKGTFYLLMEPDPNKPLSYKGWMETVVKTGRTLKQERLDSGLIVEKRQAQ